MSTVSTRSTQRPSGPGFLAVVVGSLGVVLLAYGAFAFLASPLAGGWLAVSGLCLLLSGVFATPWAVEHTELSAEGCRTASVAFAAVGVALLALFVVVNFASFEGGSAGN
ncbi:hypothetical protein JCM30237_12580 [Halolamina litorea]|uniref:Uncharacterized protein n=1 Tax=Halolamina litorea TaxID=1515593 RepID=A0ABD6BM15_9EURY|nr:hypothetical protein [Halolamina litorea]